MTKAAYRFYNTRAGGHFFTTDLAERDSVIANLPQYHYENVGFNTVEPTDTGATHVYRFYNTVAGGHFFTSDLAERDNVIANLPQYHYENVGFEASTSPGNGLQRPF